MVDFESFDLFSFIFNILWFGLLTSTFFTQFSEALNCKERKGRATSTQNIEKVEVIKHLSQIVRDIKTLILNFSNHGFKGQKTMVQYKLHLLENISVEIDVAKI